MKKNIAAFLAMAILALSVSLGASAAEVSVVIGHTAPSPYHRSGTGSARARRRIFLATWLLALG
jgi:hypothetical protein